SRFSPFSSQQLLVSIKKPFGHEPERFGRGCHEPWTTLKYPACFLKLDESPLVRKRSLFPVEATSEVQ
ncbi:hypothetical protein, partial [Brevibacillus borstelensis]|uniref:hypothetical protein n=1 Tax=Brevibacillus borstelensis TaxID=45462 RepID=UPI001FAA82E5